MTKCFINLIETAIPQNECHQEAIHFLLENISEQEIKSKVTEISQNLQIKQRYSVIDNFKKFYKDNNPSTSERMKLYQNNTFKLVKIALDKLFEQYNTEDITHLITVSCTGFYAPSLDTEIIETYNLNSQIKRTHIGFMGCHAAINAYKNAVDTIKANNEARVLVVNLELCSLHFQKNNELSKMLSNMIFADGASAAIVSNENSGLEIQNFKSQILLNTTKLMKWEIADNGFEMFIDKTVPIIIKNNIKKFLFGFVDLKNTTLWAIHPGGANILNAVQKALLLSDKNMQSSRKILESYGNMSSTTINFILKDLLNSKSNKGSGLAIAFGPGLTVEAMEFNLV